MYNASLTSEERVVRLSRNPLVILGVFLVAILWVDVAFADNLQNAIHAMPQGSALGHVDLAAEPGFLGIPGAPSINPVTSFLWAIWTGWIFSTVGAFGGVMAGVGHMSIYGLGDYAKSLGKGSPLGNTVTDSIKASNQWLVGTSALISSFNYYRMGRLVLPLAVSLGLGSIIGAWASAYFTAGKVSFSSYQGYFGLFVLVLGVYLFWETSAAGQASKKKAKEAAKAFEETVKRQKAGEHIDAQSMGVSVTSFTLSRCIFTFSGVEFSFNPLIPLVGGMVISAIAAFLGVGGGFLLVPFLTSFAELPMYLAAGTSALAVLVSMVTSIITLVSKGTPLDWMIISTQLLGIIIGSIIGPRTSKYLSDILLKRLFIVLALYVGIDYVLRGFFNFRIFG